MRLRTRIAVLAAVVALTVAGRPARADDRADNAAQAVPSPRDADVAPAPREVAADIQTASVGKASGRCDCVCECDAQWTSTGAKADREPECVFESQWLPVGLTPAEFVCEKLSVVNADKDDSGDEGVFVPTSLPRK